MPAVARALFCPQCGQAIRPTGTSCPQCLADTALPPALIPGFQSEAESLVTVALGADPRVRFRVPGLLARLGAEVIDLSLLSVFVFPLVLIFWRYPEAIPWAALALFLAYHWLWPPMLGGTPGLRLMGLALIDDHTERRPDLIQSALRVFGFGFTPLSLGLTTLTVFTHPTRRSWADLLGGTRVVARADARR